MVFWVALMHCIQGAEYGTSAGVWLGSLMRYLWIIGFLCVSLVGFGELVSDGAGDPGDWYVDGTSYSDEVEGACAWTLAQVAAPFEYGDGVRGLEPFGHYSWSDFLTGLDNSVVARLGSTANRRTHFLLGRGKKGRRALVWGELPSLYRERWLDGIRGSYGIPKRQRERLLNEYGKTNKEAFPFLQQMLLRRRLAELRFQEEAVLSTTVQDVFFGEAQTPEIVLVGALSEGVQMEVARSLPPPPVTHPVVLMTDLERPLKNSDLIERGALIRDDLVIDHNPLVNDSRLTFNTDTIVFISTVFPKKVVSNAPDLELALRSALSFGHRQEVTVRIPLHLTSVATFFDNGNEFMPANVFIMISIQALDEWQSAQAVIERRLSMMIDALTQSLDYPIVGLPDDAIRSNSMEYVSVDVIPPKEPLSLEYQFIATRRDGRRVRFVFEVPKTE